MLTTRFDSGTTAPTNPPPIVGDDSGHLDSRSAKRHSEMWGKPRPETPWLAGALSIIPSADVGRHRLNSRALRWLEPTFAATNADKALGGPALAGRLRVRWRDDAALLSDHDHLGPVPGPEFLPDPAQMFHDGVPGKPQHLGDLLVARALSDPFQQVALTRGQGLMAGRQH